MLSIKQIASVDIEKLKQVCFGPGGLFAEIDCELKIARPLTVGNYSKSQCSLVLNSFQVILSWLFIVLVKSTLQLLCRLAYT
mgnify:FL=1